MWQPEQVERALFRWSKWRCSLIHQWASETDLHKLSLNDVRSRARAELQKLGFEGPMMAVYWICSVASECNLDYEASFTKILIPSWFPLRFDRRLLRWYSLKPGVRVYPPRLLTKKDMDRLRRQSGLDAGVYISTGTTRMLLPPDHEFYSIIGAMKGRPRKRSKPGRPPSYPDRLAVKCAVLKTPDKTYVQIAKQLGLPVTDGELHELSKRSDVVRHLVSRGRKLINEWELGRLK
jgi:hypothetical protein